MRIYHSFHEVLSEVARDLKEMGIKVQTKTYQNKDISQDPGMATFELQNYIYMVTSPNLGHLNVVQPWADAELIERLGGIPLNPGEAQKLRPELWEQFLQGGKHDYTYAERLNLPGNKVEQAIRTLQNDQSSRQAFINIWEGGDIFFTGGVKRVPCSLGYHVMVRDEQVHLTYLQRSCDFATHFQSDLFFAHGLQRHIAEQLHLQVGNYTHWIGSLHVFHKDVKDVF